MRVCATQAWPLFMIAPASAPGSRVVEVGVVEDDRRRLAAELEGAALELLAAERADALARPRCEPVKLTLSMPGWRHEVLADLAAGGHDVDDARRAARPRSTASASR